MCRPNICRRSANLLISVLNGNALAYLANKAVQRAKDLGYPLVWVGGWRSSLCLLSPAMWNRFAWPYFRKLVKMVVDADLIALLHLDSNWTRELARFRELPRGKCIMALDGETDIFRAEEVLENVQAMVAAAVGQEMMP